MALDDEDLSDAIDAAARAPKKAQDGNTSAEAHPLPDLIEADAYLRSRNAQRSGGGLGILYRRFVPPGAAGTSDSGSR